MLCVDEFDLISDLWTLDEDFGVIEGVYLYILTTKIERLMPHEGAEMPEEMQFDFQKFGRDLWAQMVKLFKCLTALVFFDILKHSTPSSCPISSNFGEDSGTFQALLEATPPGDSKKASGKWTIAYGETKLKMKSKKPGPLM